MDLLVVLKLVYSRVSTFFPVRINKGKRIVKLSSNSLSNADDIENSSCFCRFKESVKREKV